jgi:CIC family chloride channel protein
MGAVFAGSACIPIASILMVAEMTGGYHLLLTTTLAVIVSELFQVDLSRRLEYDTLYEAQVPGRNDLPAQQVKHLDPAICLFNINDLKCQTLSAISNCLR